MASTRFQSGFTRRSLEEPKIFFANPKNAIEIRPLWADEG